MQKLYETYNRITSTISHRFTRYLYEKIDWKERLIEINGARGVGKTTLMLQKSMDINKDASIALYASLDNPYFYNRTLDELADDFYKNGGKYLFLDEVHKYPPKHPEIDWSFEIKSIHDNYPDLNIIYSGSSLLRLYKGQGDLSRRRSAYNLKGLSFREFLEYENKIKMEAVPFGDLLSNHLSVSREISTRIKIIPHFREYLKHGYYPFYKESPDNYFDRLKDVINVILETDIPLVADIPFEIILKIKKLLGAIGSSVPYTPHLTDLRSALYVSDQRTLLKYLDYLEKAELISTIGKNVTGGQILRKPDKIYLNNTNLLHVLDNSPPNVGTIRETFFHNQLSSILTLKYPVKGDFSTKDDIYFEIGGKNKQTTQIKEYNKGYLALDDIETGYNNTIPLWLFGFLY